jgi:hypothetical protein
MQVKIHNNTSTESEGSDAMTLHEHLNIARAWGGDSTASTNVTITAL